MKKMSKEEFLRIHDRWVSSGLLIKDFCRNEVYSRSSFFYWKKKFGLSRTRRNQSTQNAPATFAPVSFSSLTGSAKLNTPPCETCIQEEICIELPGGTKIHLKGMSDSKIALSLLTQICSNHVLPE